MTVFSKHPGLTRRRLAATALTMPAVLTLPRLLRAAGPVRIGYQKNGALVILQQHKQHKQLNTSGMAVQWVYFTSGPPMLEALNAGAVDFAATATRRRSSLRPPDRRWFTSPAS